MFLHFLYLEETGWFYFKTNLTASERQLESSDYFGALMLKFHWHSSVNHQKDGILVQDAACYCLHQFLGFYDDSTLITQVQECYLFLGWSKPVKAESGIGSAWHLHGRQSQANLMPIHCTHQPGSLQGNTCATILLVSRKKKKLEYNEHL